jgi:hypothetical protein
VLSDLRTSAQAPLVLSLTLTSSCRGTSVAGRTGSRARLPGAHYARVPQRSATPGTGSTTAVNTAPGTTGTGTTTPDDGESSSNSPAASWALHSSRHMSDRSPLARVITATSGEGPGSPEDGAKSASSRHTSPSRADTHLTDVASLLSSRPTGADDVVAPTLSDRHLSGLEFPEASQAGRAVPPSGGRSWVQHSGEGERLPELPREWTGNAAQQQRPARTQSERLRLPGSAVSPGKPGASGSLRASPPRAASAMSLVPPLERALSGGPRATDSGATRLPLGVPPATAARAATGHAVTPQPPEGASSGVVGSSDSTPDLRAFAAREATGESGGAGSSQPSTSLSLRLAPAPQTSSVSSGANALRSGILLPGWRAQLSPSAFALPASAGQQPPTRVVPHAAACAAAHETGSAAAPGDARLQRAPSDPFLDEAAEGIEAEEEEDDNVADADPFLDETGDDSDVEGASEAAGDGPAQSSAEEALGGARHSITDAALAGLRPVSTDMGPSAVLQSPAHLAAESQMQDDSEASADSDPFLEG